jgi:hypothetical protein
LRCGNHSQPNFRMHPCVCSFEYKCQVTVAQQRCSEEPNWPTVCVAPCSTFFRRNPRQFGKRPSFPLLVHPKLTNDQRPHQRHYQDVVRDCDQKERCPSTKHQRVPAADSNPKPPQPVRRIIMELLKRNSLNTTPKQRNVKTAQTPTGPQSAGVRHGTLSVNR